MTAPSDKIKTKTHSPVDVLMVSRSSAYFQLCRSYFLFPAGFTVPLLQQAFIKRNWQTISVVIHQVNIKQQNSEMNMLVISQHVAHYSRIAT